MQSKVIIITGISRGLGYSLSNHWLHNNVIIGIGRTCPKDLYNKINYYECDLRNHDNIEFTIKSICKKYPKIDLLINNAASLTSKPLVLMSDIEISNMIDLNIKATIFLSRAVFRKMLINKSGNIINILSMAPKVNAIGDSVYAASKSAIETFSQILNREGHPFGIHVNNIAISGFPSGMLDQIISQNSKKVLDLIHHKQYAPLSEIIASIEFFEKNTIDIGGQTLYFGGM